MVWLVLIGRNTATLFQVCMSLRGGVGWCGVVFFAIGFTLYWNRWHFLVDGHQTDDVCFRISSSLRILPYAKRRPSVALLSIRSWEGINLRKSKSIMGGLIPNIRSIGLQEGECCGNCESLLKFDNLNGNMFDWSITAHACVCVSVWVMEPGYRHHLVRFLDNVFNVSGACRFQYKENSSSSSIKRATITATNSTKRYYYLWPV